ncbi:MAG: hypothetical protein KatS3mg031_2106 [Chitinophagales bacterium]|nr:MAG: hypothetical protein KatS3mg031_2106 [Chitinophagales bacterium]
MSEDNTVSAHITKIKSTFQEILEYCHSISQQDAILQHLSGVHEHTRPVAYEAAAMFFALRDMDASASLYQWQSFVNKTGDAYATHTFIGLGWAVAQKQIPLNKLKHTLRLPDRCRVADGCGYYEGLFRHRKAVGLQQYPAYMDTALQKAFDQGLGRSVWYFSQGDPEKTAHLITLFRADRQDDLWRGVGTAAAFVGGCSTETLQHLSALAATFRAQLTTGAAMALKSRTEAGCVTADTVAACTTLWQLTSKQIMLLAQRAYQQVADQDDGYFHWITLLENAFKQNFPHDLQCS